MIGGMTVVPGADGSLSITFRPASTSQTTPPTPPSAAAPGAGRRKPAWGFTEGLEKAFRAIEAVAVGPRSLVAQAKGKQAVTEDEFLAVRKSYQTLGKRIRRKLAGEGILFDEVYVDVPGKRPGSTVKELWFRRKTTPKGEMS